MRDSLTGEVVYTSAPGLFDDSDLSALKGPVPGPIPDEIGALIPSLPPKVHHSKCYQLWSLSMLTKEALELHCAMLTTDMLNLLV